MKTRIAVVAMAAAAFFLISTTTGTVEDKQAPGIPGEKTYEVLVNGSWRIVPEAVWDRCDVQDSFPLCAVSGTPQ